MRHSNRDDSVAPARQQWLRLKPLLRRLAVPLALVIAIGGVAAPAASAYSYDYGFQLYDETWGSRWVAHNYSYVTTWDGASTTLNCHKLIRTSNGAQYGDTVCSYDTAGRHWAGDTGTYVHLYYNSPYNNSPAVVNVHEEW